MPTTGRTKHNLLTIGDFARRAGVPPSALRFYERQGLINSERTAGNQRRYRRAQLRRVAFIRSAQRVGLSLSEIASALSELPNDRIPTTADWAKLSQNWHDRLTDQITLLERIRDELTSCIGCGCLSVDNCSLLNTEDKLSAEGPGARILLREES